MHCNTLHVYVYFLIYLYIHILIPQIEVDEMNATSASVSTRVYIYLSHCNTLKHTETHSSTYITHVYLRVQPIADRVALNLEIISQTSSTNQNSAHGIYD